MKQILGAYLSDVERGLEGLSSGRRRLILRELEAHLEDEAEAREVRSEAQMAALLAEKENPGDLAAQLSHGEGTDASHRSGTALVAGCLIGLASGGYLLVEGAWQWHIVLAFGAAHGLAVGAGTLLVRPRWQRLGARTRILISMALGTLLAIPLGFTTTWGFSPSLLFYGGFTGYMLERHSQERPPWHVVLETLAFTGLDFLMYSFVLRHCHPYVWIDELSFNFTLALAVLLAARFKRLLSGRWILAPQ